MPAIDLMPRMWELLNSISDDALNAAVKKVSEMNFDPDKGEIPLSESFFNLESAIRALRDAIEQQKLTLLPISLQKELIGKLEAVSSCITRLNSGTDEVINVGAAIEQLNSAIWLYGVHNQSAEVLGFQSKMNQLKNEELLLVQLRKELETGLALKQELLALRTESEAGRKAIASAQIASEEGMTKVREKLDETTAISQSAAALALVVQQNETTTLNVAATAKTSGAEVQAVEARIKEFFAQIDAYRVKIDTVSTDARNCIDGNKTEMEKLVSNLSNLEDQIKKQIERATGFSLFHSFQTRQGKITWAKRFWGVMLAIVICASVGLTAYIAHSTTVFDIGFYLKLSMSVPLIFALSFCTIQYSRERRLEEEYAFRSSISISLDPYQELVSRLIDKAQPEERQKFTAFLIDSIQRVFTSPTERIFEPKDKSKAATEKSLKLLAEIAGQFSKAAKG